MARMINKLARLLRDGPNAFIVHGNADSDALASAFVLSSIFRGDIVVPEGLDRTSKKVAESLSINFREELSRSYKRLVVVDTSGPEQLGKLSHLGDDESIIVIDHHTRNAAWSANIYYCDEKKSSCCEIVYDISRASGKKLKRKTALALLAGILTDSGHFRYGNADTLVAFSRIMKDHGISMHDVLALVEGEMGLSERISQLKGAQRLKYIRVEDYVIATSHGSAFEASVCRSLLQMGADIAFVGSQRGERFRISARASSDAVDLGIHLGKILEGIASDTSNGGGGHPGAAGLTGKGDVKYMLNVCVQRSRKALKSLLLNAK